MEDFIVAKADKNQQVEVSEQNAQEEQVLTDSQIKNQKKQEKLQQKKQAKAKENKKDKKKASEPKQKNNKAREVVGELKKVTWPTFGKVVKNTLLVIGIVLLITIGLFVVDRLFSWVYQLLVNGYVDFTQF